MMEEEPTQAVGPKGRHDSDRVAERNGAAAGSVVGGRRVPVSRRRAVSVDGIGRVAWDGYASLLKTVCGAEYEDERDARFINDRVHANIQNDGTFSVVLPVPGGVNLGGAAAHDRRCR